MSRSGIYFWPATAVEMKPLGDGFIKLIKMVIALVIFCTVVSGIAGMESMKKVGRVGGKALLYFEVVSTLALVLGLIVGNAGQAGCRIQCRSRDARRQGGRGLCRQGARSKPSSNSC